MAARKKTSKKKTAKKKAIRKATVTPSSLPKDHRGLPKEVRDELRTEREQGNTDNVINVIDPVEPTSINQIIIGLWLNHKEVVKRASVQAKLSYLIKQGKVRRCGRGSYVLTGK